MASLDLFVGGVHSETRQVDEETTWSGSKHRDTDMQHHGQGWKTPQRKSSFKHDTESRSWRCRPGILRREDCKVKASLGK